MKSKLAKVFVSFAMLFTVVFNVMIDDIYANDAQPYNGVDIRDYFEGDFKTIITDTKLVFKDAQGNIITPLELDLGAQIEINYDFKIPLELSNKIKGGDYFEFKLPEGVVPERKIDIDLKDGEDAYAVLHIDIDGNAKIVFNNMIEGLSDIEGNAHVGGKLDEAIISKPGDHTIKIPVEDELEDYPIFVKPNVESTIEKKGYGYNKETGTGSNPDHIVWDVLINKKLDLLGEKVITDKLPDGLILESIEVYEVEFDFEGNPIGEGKLLDSDLYSFESSTNTVTIGGQEPTRKGYRVRYNTTIEEGLMPEGGGVKLIKNNVTLKSDDLEESAESTISANYDEPIVKYSGSVDNKNQSIYWQIMYNKRKQTIAPGTTITDTIKGGMDFVESTMLLLTGSGKKLIEGVDYTVEYALDNEGNNTFEIKFLKELSEEIRINYASKLDEDILEATVIFNEVIDSNGHHSENIGYLQPHKIIKRHKNPDYKNATIAWDLKVNEYNEKDNKMINAVVTDDLDAGLSVLKDTLKVYSETKSKELTTDDYDVEFLSEDVEVNGVFTTKESFVITFKGAYAETDEELRITYVTKFDSNVLKENETFTNKANLKWEVGDEIKSLDTSDSFNPDKKSKLNGNKIGSYNPHNKEITWSIAINYGQTVLGHSPYIKDKIKGNQKFISGSLKAYEYELRDNDVIHRLEEIPLENVVAPGEEIQYPTEENGNTLFIPLRESSFDQKSHRILYDFKTTLKDEIIENSNTYYNTAEFSEGEGFPIHTLEASVDIKHGGELITKSGIQNKETGFVEWSVIVNGSQSKVDEAVIEDTLSPLLSIKQDSIKIYKTKIDDTGEIILLDEELEAEKYELTIERITNEDGFEQDRFTISFKEQINESYQVKYQSAVIVEEEEVPPSKELQVSNKIKFKGNNKLIVEQETEDEVTIKVSTGGGTIVGKRSKLKVIKEDSNTGVPLAGAKFKIERVENDKKTSLGIFESDDEGIVVINPIVRGTYILTEVESPAGYIIDPELKAGKEITIPSNEEGGYSVIRVQNNQNSFTVNKVDERDRALAGVEFVLEKFVNDNYQEIDIEQSLVTDNQGKITLTGLKPGKYQLVEIQSVDGHAINTNPIKFDVLDGLEVVNNDVKFINYKGSVLLKKTDGDGNPLQDTKFELLKEDGSVVGKYITDQDGVIYADGLDVGKYQFIEVKPTDGYVGSGTFSFEINSEYSGKQEIIAEPIVNEKTEVKLIKVNEDNEFLEGVRFKLFKHNGIRFVEENTEQELITNSKGEIILKGLHQGKYQLREESALAGYIKNTDHYNFTIDDKGNVTVEKDDYKFVNYQQRVILNKCDTEGNKLAGVKFELIDSDQNTVIESELITNENGQIILEGVHPGNYTLREIEALPGFNEPVSKDFEVLAEQTGLVKDIVINSKNKKSKVEFIKTSKEGELLAGAVFELYQEKEDSLIQIHQDIEYISDEEGQVIIQGLTAGNYQLKEVKAPSGYLINETPISFTVDKDEEGFIIDKTLDNFINYLGSVELIKTDAKGKPLKGVEFKLEDKAGNTINERMITDKKGAIFIDALPVGDYKFIETKGLPGFKDDQVIEFSITDAAFGEPETVYVSAINELLPENPKTPQTDTISTYSVYITIILLSLILLYTDYWKVKTQNK